jgi:hypothetical protein
MATESSLFDVVIFGCDLIGAEREAARQKLAQMFNCELHEADKLLRARGLPLKRGIPAAEARQLQHVLVGLGIRCNYRPSQSTGLHLELVATEEEEEAPLECPACGHSHPVAPDVPKPEVCEKCGVVFSKYEKANQLKEEREQIKRRLLEAHQRSLAEQAAEQKRREDEERRRLLEEQIRKELGLPRFVTTRRGIISSAAVLFGLGVSIGAGTVYMFTNDWAGGTGVPGISAQAMAKLDPAVSTHLQAQNLLEGDPGFMNGLLGGDSAKAPDTPAKTALVPDMLAELAVDVEWDRFLATRIDDLVAKGSIIPAIELVDHIRRPLERIRQGARLAETLRTKGRTVEAEKMFNRLSNFAESLSDEAARVEALSELARHQANPEVTLASARLIADHIAAPAAQAVAQAEIGSARMKNIEDLETARGEFARANQAIARIADPMERALTVARIARSYARGGSRGGAATLLEDVMRPSAALAPGEARNRIFNEVVQVYAEMGDIPAALGAADKIGPPAARDKAVYELVISEVSRGRLPGAMDAAETIKHPGYQARALGLLSLAQLRDPFQPNSPVSFQRAEAAADSLANPMERAAVLSEIARYASRDPNNRQADRLFGEADKLAETLVNPAERGSAEALLAANYARALRFNEADKKAGEIRDPELAQSLTLDLAEIKTAGTLAKP